MANPVFGPRARYFTNIAAGALRPLANGYVYTYEAGTVTPKATYNSSVGDVANTNPVRLDSEGYADIYLGSGDYKIDVKDENGVSLPGYPKDDVEGTVRILDTITAASSTSIAMATGSKIFEIESNKALPVNSWVLISYDGDPADNYMIGQISDYTGTNLTVDVSQFEGSGTYNDWTIALSGPPGPEGPTGPNGAGTGDLLAANNLSDLASAATARGNLGLGSSAVLDVGTTANKVLQLDASANIPAVSGQNLTALNASNLSSGTIATGRLGSGTASAGTFLRGDQTWESPAIVTTSSVGDYVWARKLVGDVSYGGTTSGSNLDPAGYNTDTSAYVFDTSTSLGGTWTCKGYATSVTSGNDIVTLWQRTA